jgi:hypothetical protein
MNLSRCLVGKEWKVAQREIDWEVEAHFGYTFLGKEYQYPMGYFIFSFRSSFSFSCSTPTYHQYNLILDCHLCYGDD